MKLSNPEKSRRKSLYQHVPLTVLVCLAMVVAATTVAMSAKNKVERTFSTVPGGRLLLVSDIASVEIESWEKNEVHMSVVIEGTEENVRDFRLTHTKSGAVVKIRGIQSNRNAVGWGPQTTAAFKIRVPKSYNVDVGTTSGPIDVTQLSGVLRLRSQLGHVTVKRSFGSIDVASKSGEVKIVSCRGTVRAENVSGTIVASSVSGVVNSRTVDGEITVEGVRGGLQLFSVHGDISISLTRQTTTVIAESAQGDVVLKLPSGYACSIEATTAQGEIDVDWKARFRGTSDPRYLHGMVNGGGPLIRLSSHSGDIDISD